MFKKQRHEVILDYLKKHRFARVADLAALVDASEITIRRDIIELDKENKLTKVYGGAKIHVLFSDDISYSERSIENLEVKNKIAEAASHYVKDNMKVYLDAGSSVFCLIPYLEDKNIEVFTHGIHHVEALAKLNIKTHVIGGEIKASTLALVGSTTIMSLSQFRFDICFMGANAIDHKQGFMTPDISEAMVKRKVIEQSDLAIVLADNSKFDASSNVVFWEKKITVLTDQKVDDLYKKFDIRVV